MNQTWKNGEKANFGPNFSPSDPNVGCQCGPQHTIIKIIKTIIIIIVTIITDQIVISIFLTKRRNCHNSRTSYDTDLKLRPVTKLDKRNKTTSKKLADDVIFRKFWRHYHSFNLQPIWSNLEARFQAQSVKLISSLIVTFYLTKTKNTTKNL